MQPADLHPHVTDVVNQDIMLRLVSTKKQLATNVGKWAIYRKSAEDNSIPSSSFTVGQSVLVRVYGQTHKWTRGSILKSTGSLSYVIKLPNGSTCRCHQDQLKSC